MPIYEYVCKACGRVSSFLIRRVAEHKRPACPHCGSRKTSRAVSRFSAVSGKSPAAEGGEEPGGEDLAEVESMLGGLDENDPRSLGRMMRAMADKTGEALDPEMDEACRRLEAGERPEDIEEKMGGALGGGEGSGGDALYDG
jgi:putative FmdB family regulatory protein